MSRHEQFHSAFKATVFEIRTRIQAIELEIVEFRMDVKYIRKKNPDCNLAKFVEQHNIASREARLIELRQALDSAELLNAEGTDLAHDLGNWKDPAPAKSIDQILADCGKALERFA